MEFKAEIGDVVFLKSGGPQMTVIEVANERGLVNCIWFERNNGNFGQLETGQFHFRTLNARLEK